LQFPSSGRSFRQTKLGTDLCDTSDSICITVGDSSFDRLAHVYLVHQVFPGGIVRQMLDELPRLLLNV
jgi:hypothetical protein